MIILVSQGVGASGEPAPDPIGGSAPSPGGRGTTAGAILIPGERVAGFPAMLPARR
jgi:hypothetical protein